MGEVYRGRDTRLGRDVALKVISSARVGDASLRRRFETEARAASVLNHPSIVTVYDVGDTDGIPWIAMEWVDGRTLRQAMEPGPFHLREALKIAQQIADGLAAAHGKGIVHRDLKPGNVILTPEGRCKIVDFGLARQAPAEALAGPISKLDTMDAPSDATHEGAILGTVGYMSPEQAAGKPVDFRCDQFSLGVILYEMLAGRRAFERPTPVETLAAVIREEPEPLASLRPSTPEPLQRLVATCLAKRPEDRFASTRALAITLEEMVAGTSGASGPATETDVHSPAHGIRPRRAPSRRLLLWGGALALALAAAAAGYRYFASSSAIDSLAVLPFENKSSDPEAEYLGDGLTENLIGQMSRIASLKVMARATVFRYKGTGDPIEAGRTLGVGAILTGSVIRRGDRLSVSAELVEVRSGARIWGETYERPVSDLLMVQDSIAWDISERLRLHLSLDEKRTLTRRGTNNPEAYDLFLKAAFAFARDTEDDDLEARRLFQQAFEKDPRFVEARAGYATSFARAAVNGYERPAEAWPHVDEEMRKALEIEPGNLHARAQVTNRRFFYEWDFARVDREYRELMNDPRLLQVKQFRPIHPIAISLWVQGAIEEAVVLLDRGLNDDPGNVETLTMRADLLAHAGDLDAAVTR
jgi:TolB-like protein/predicted Ser/Thr protein kinase